MRIGIPRLPCVLMIALTASTAITSCASLETKQRSLVDGLRVTPSSADHNRVYVDFSDQTGEGAEFEDSVYEAICNNVEARGYELARHDEADYVLWATLRCFEQTGTEGGNKTLAGLGGIAGGVAAAVVASEVTDNPAYVWTFGAGGGWFFGWLIERLTRTEHWAMAIDLQLARRLDEEAKKTIRVEDQSRIRSATISGFSSGVVDSVEGGSSGQDVTATTEVTLPTVFLELEQRVIVEATARRKTKEEVAEALLVRLANGLAAHLPRNRP